MTIRGSNTRGFSKFLSLRDVNQILMYLITVCSLFTCSQRNVSKVNVEMCQRQIKGYLSIRKRLIFFILLVNMIERKLKYSKVLNRTLSPFINIYHQPPGYFNPLLLNSASLFSSIFLYMKCLVNDFILTSQ